MSRTTIPRMLLAALGPSALALAPPPLAAQAEPPAGVEEVVMAVAQEACDAVLDRDLEALKRLLAPEFTLVGSDSRVQTRGDLLAEVRAGEPEYDEFRNHDMTARVYDDAAIVQGITSLAGRVGGEPFALQVRFTDTLVRADGEWRLIVSHVTRIPE